MSYALCVDTFRRPYVEFTESFRFPSVHLDRLRAEEVAEVSSLIQSLPLPWLDGFSPLPADFHPNAGPRLYWIRDVSTQDQKLAFLFRCAASYLGGCATPLGPPAQGIAPSFETNRIYFHCWLVPIKDFKTDSNRITGFEADTLQLAVETRHAKPAEETVFRGGSLLFDSLDFSSLNRSLSERFSFGARMAFLSVYMPFVIEHLSLCAHLLHPSPKIQNTLPTMFAALLRSAPDDFASVPAYVEDFWKTYYESFVFERILSPGGNPHWRFVSTPG